MSSKIRAAVIVAHPDDETIFFGGLIQAFKYDWTVICVTNGNADGQGTQRQKDFAAACKALKVKKFECWNYPDHYETRLDLEKLTNQLKSLNFKKVFTHGVLGEYGHPHHQDVSYAVHQAFNKRAQVFSISYNAFPKIRIELSASQYKKKSEILWNTYASEVSRFLHLLPATSSEGFIQCSFEEVQTLYLLFSKGLAPDTRRLKNYKWLQGYFEKNLSGTMPRPF